MPPVAVFGAFPVVMVREIPWTTILIPHLSVDEAVVGIDGFGGAGFSGVLELVEFDVGCYDVERSIAHNSEFTFLADLGAETEVGEIVELHLAGMAGGHVDGCRTVRQISRESVGTIATRGEACQIDAVRVDERCRVWLDQSCN